MESLKFIQSSLPDQIQRVKITCSFLDYGKVESGVPQEPILRPLFLNIFIHDLLFDNITIDTGDYADDPNTNYLENNLEIE